MTPIFDTLPFSFGTEADRARRDGLPMVALESTVITHGLPYPDNLEVARLLEQTVRGSGAVPATIAIRGGRVCVGLEDDQLEELARGREAQKLNLSNLASGIVSGRPGSTTVGATMYIASLAGIRVFATGGIGGVHRGVAESMDISGDLGALARFPVAVVSAGAKAILDLPRTVELLETLGVPVYGWRTDEFPAFYRAESGLPVDARFDDLETLAAAVSLHWRLGLAPGILVANPIPAERALPEGVYTRAIGEALAAARAGSISGRDLTPFLLDVLRRETGGRSVDANTALLENNARLAAQLAATLE